MFAKVVGAALVLGAMFAAPANAASVPASFDCAKAASTVEKLICSQAVLRWQDLSLSRNYRAARNTVTGSARDDLVLAQRDWVRERDRRCIADRTFAELADTAAELGKQAYECLNVAYLDRRRVLQDLASPPLPAGGIREIDLQPIAAARQQIVEDGTPRIAGIRMSPDGALVAILLPSLELDGPDQVWLYGVADGRLAAATPMPDMQQPHPDGAPMAIRALAWQGGTLYVRLALWSAGSESEEGPSAVYAATLAGSAQMGTVPAAVVVLLDGDGAPTELVGGEMTDSDGESPQAVRGNGDFLVWIDDRGHGTIELKTRKRAAGSPARPVAWGNWRATSSKRTARNSSIRPIPAWQFSTWPRMASAALPAPRGATGPMRFPTISALLSGPPATPAATSS
ncbi:lysozyme inhibitor LprI family protein [Nitrobacter sp.]|uniref:lysozyme inhibitor LprI family protein n=1 Tax=Nitrobacter sp. TaxID=29420 RepID=UPI00399D700D